jgi:hypothetical protein
MNLCLFMQTGRTFTFKDVKMVCDNETVLEFDYRAMSDGKTKRGTFQKAIVAGWSKSR